MRRVLLLTFALAGCAHHPLSCAIGLPYDDCLSGTSGAEAYARGQRIDPVAEMMVLNYAAGVQAAGWGSTVHALDSYLGAITPPAVIVAPRVYSPPVTYYAPR